MLTPTDLHTPGAARIPIDGLHARWPIFVVDPLHTMFTVDQSVACMLMPHRSLRFNELTAVPVHVFEDFPSLEILLVSSEATMYIVSGISFQMGD